MFKRVLIPYGDTNDQYLQIVTTEMKMYLKDRSLFLDLPELWDVLNIQDFHAYRVRLSGFIV